MLLLADIVKYGRKSVSFFSRINYEVDIFMRKHAYLVIAHNNFQQLEFLLSLLDDEKNDIFLLIDKKSEISASVLKSLNESCNKSIFTLVERVKINWGGYSQIKAELILLKAAVHNNYSYYHLISGSDLPLFSQDYIHEFFDKNPNKIFLSMVNDEIKERNNVVGRIKYKHYFNEIYGNFRGNYVGKLISKCDQLSIRLQQLLKKEDVLKKKGIKYVGYSSQWFSIDNETAKMIVDKSKYIESVFKKSFLSDEVFLPTMIFKENLDYKLYTKHTLHDIPNELQGNLRYINWWESSLTDGSPYVWQDGDEEQLAYAADLGHLFARKFDLKKSPALKNFILEKCQK